MLDVEGVTKYELDYVPSVLPGDADVVGLRRWFRHCRERDLIGRDPNRYGGYAYGNISVRAQRGFIISGTQTGGATELGEDQLAWVVDFNVATNRLKAGGPARPSSEAMSHGQIYRALPGVTAVIHVHSPVLWHAADNIGLPSTPRDALYGTPAMAAAVNTLLIETDQPCGLFTMGGHEDGVIAYADDIDQAGTLLLDALDRAAARG